MKYLQIATSLLVMILSTTISVKLLEWQSTSSPAQDLTKSAQTPLISKALEEEPLSDSSLDEPSYLPEMTVEEKVGQLFMVGFKEEDDARLLLDQYKVGSLILFNRNDYGIENLKTITDSLRQESRFGLIIATDQEGGSVQRLKNGFTEIMPAQQAGQELSLEELEGLSQNVATELKLAGINMNLAPVADINEHNDNPVLGARTFSNQVERVTDAVLAYQRGHRKAGVVSVLKHFPGHGGTSVDSHASMPVVQKDKDQLLSNDLLPFKRAIEDGAEAVMVAHIAYPALNGGDRTTPASLSRDMIEGLLREELKFRGVVITDDVGMSALENSFSSEKIAVDAINAGADIILCVRKPEVNSCSEEMFQELYDALVNAVRSQEIPIERLDQSVERVLILKRGLLEPGQEKLNSEMIQKQEIV